MFQQALKFQKENTFETDSYDEFKTLIKDGGFIRCGWDGNLQSETSIKMQTKATIRCILSDNSNNEKLCIFSGNSAKYEVIYAKSY